PTSLYTLSLHYALPIYMPATSTVAHRGLEWRMWVPCLGMALCSWLSFVDRQVLTILSPTIIRDTGLTAQNFTDAASFFFLAYTLDRKSTRLNSSHEWIS